MIEATTILAVRHQDKTVLAGDGQVTLGQEVLKHSARKLRRLYKDKVVAGFAGSTADAFSLFSRFEAKLEQFNGNLPRGVVELAKEWRTDRVLRHLEALLLVPLSAHALFARPMVIAPSSVIAIEVLDGNQSSGVLTSTVWGDGLVDNPAGRTIARGDPVTFISLAELLA